MRAAHMAEKQICEPCSKLDLSVHPRTDKQTEWWSKRAVILLHGYVDALVLPSSSPLPPLSLMPAATLRRTCRLQKSSPVECTAAERTVKSFSLCFDRPLPLCQTVVRECSVWARQLAVCFHMLETPLCVIYHAICLCYWEKLVKEHVVICYCKKFNKSTPTLFLLAVQEMFPFLLLEYQRSLSSMCHSYSVSIYRRRKGATVLPVFYTSHQVTYSVMHMANIYINIGKKKSHP